MALTSFTDIASLVNFIQTYIVANNNKQINGDEMESALLGIIGFINPSLAADLTVALGPGGSLGSITDGQLLVKGTTLESIIRSVLIKAIHPTYVAPTLVLQSNLATLIYEVGTVISPVLSNVYTQNDAGAAITQGLKKNGSLIASSFPYTDVNVSLDDITGALYQAFQQYADGAIKNNNLGAADGSGRILAATLNSNTIQYIGARKLFYGTPASVPGVSADIRALSGSFLNPQVGSIIPIAIAAGSTMICFAYPATLRDVSSVQYVELNAEVKGAFTKTLINVNGLNGYAVASYKVYTYQPVQPFQNNINYKVII